MADISTERNPRGVILRTIRAGVGRIEQRFSEWLATSASLQFQPLHIRILAAALIVGVGFCIRWSLDGLLGPRLAYPIFYPVVMIAALAGGATAGAVAVGLSVVVVSVWRLPPQHAADLVAPAVFLVAGVLTVILTTTLQAAQFQVRQGAARRESEVRLRAIFDQQFQFMAVLSPDGRLLEVNDMPLKVDGLDRDSLIGLHFWDAPWFRDLPEVRALWPNRLAIAARLDGPYIFTETGTAGNGRLRHVDASITAVRASDESVQFFIVQAHDTTDQKHAERALRESEEQLRLAVEAAQLGFFDHDQRRDVLSWSPQMRSILGFSADEPVALPTYLDLVPADRRPLLAASIAKSHDPAGDGEFSAEHPVVLRDGRHLWISLRVHTIFEGEGAARKPVRTIGSLMDVTRRKANEHHQELLIAELDHRVKNTLARVSSVVVFTRQNSSSMPAFIASFEGRLQSMAQAHALLSRSHWKDVVLGELVRQQLAPYYKPGRVCIDGDEIRVSPDPAQALAMLLHELATNAVKYGSLSGEHGHVSVSWRKIGEPSLGQRLQLIWQEADGPPVHPPKRSGFGSVLIQDILSYEMDGKAELDFATTGLRCTIGIPLRELHRRDVMESGLLGQPLPAQPRAASECRP